MILQSRKFYTEVTLINLLASYSQFNFGGYMHISERELWTLVHGMGFGAAYLLAFAGGLAGLYSLRPELVTAQGISERVRRLRYGIVAMAVIVWLTVLVGTYVVYPWYRAAPPKDVDQKVQSEQLRAYPRYWLLASEETAEYHDFAMEWKEHVAWISPLLATVVAFAVMRYGDELANNARARNMLMALFFLSFAIAGIAGALGALITKAAPVL
jgi:hypothetical protein